MSWSASTLEAQPKDGIALVGTPQTLPEGVDEAYADQRTAVEECIDILAQVVGAADDRVVVSVGGHANPGHASAGSDGIGETISISISAIAVAATHEDLVKAAKKPPPHKDK